MLSIAGFETGLDDWIQGTGDDGDWTRRSGSTPSSDTGPSAAYSGNYYLYTEASTTPGNPNKSAFLEKTFDFSAFSDPELRFYYHMYGSDIGTLYVDANNGSGWNIGVWHRTGQQHTSGSDAWTQATVDLSTYARDSAVTVRLRGVTGSGYKSDMAIDDVEIVGADTVPPTVTNCLPTPDATISLSSIDIDITFSEEVQGVDATDLVLSNTAAAVASVGTPIDQGGNTWRFPVSGLIPGTLDVSLAPDADDIEDLAGIDLNPSSTQWIYYTVEGSSAPTAVDLLSTSDTGISDNDNLTNLDNSTAEKVLQFGVSGTIPGATVTIYSDDMAIGSALASDTTTIVTTDGYFSLADGSRSITARQAETGKIGSVDSGALSVTIDTFEPWQAEYITGKLLASDGAEDDNFGYSVSVSGSTAIVSAYLDDDRGTGSGSVYIFEQTVAGWAQIAKLTADDGVADDRFGGSVSISGTTAIVGMVGDDDNGSSSGSAYIFQQTGAGWEQIAKLVANDGVADDCFGISVSISGTTAIVGAHWDDDNGINSGSAYIFEETSTGWEQVAKLTDDDNEAYGDHFGISVSISGKTVIVGAYQDCDSDYYSGSAYIFEQTATGWEQVSKLTPDDGAHGDLFGSSVSISGAMAIVGAYGNDDNGSSSGSAYIFEQMATGWEQIVKLTADDGVANDRFGGSVSISGAMAIVGAYGNDDNGSSSGSAYIFERSATGWEQIDKLVADDGMEDDYFGNSVSISGATAIVGAYGNDDDDNYTNFGSAYTFSLVPQIDLQATSDTGPSDTDNITSDTTPTFDITATPYYRLYRDGTQISGDYETATSYTSAELPDGAYEYTVVAVDEAGNVTLPSITLSVTIDTVAPDVSGIVPDLQSASDLGLSDTDNLTCDATPTFDVSGTPYYRFFLNGTEVSSGYQSGSFTLPGQSDGTYSLAVIAVDAAGHESALGESLSITIETVAPPPTTAPDLQAMSDSGFSNTDNITSDITPTFDVSATDYYRLYRDDVLVSGDFETLDSYTTPVLHDGFYNYTITSVDEAGNESSPSPALSVTIDTLAPRQADITTKLLPGDGTADDNFGYSVSIGGTTAIVGSYRDDDNGTDSGSAYVFEQASTGWEQVAKLTTNDGAAYDNFGYSVSISGTTAIVGTVGDNDNGSSSGSAYIFEQTATGWKQVAKLTADDGATYDEFGSSVSISGATAIVGAYGNDDDGSYSGSAYIFEQTATGWEQIAKLTADDGVADDRFGGSVSISGTTVVVGSYRDDDNGTDSGSAYIFEQTATGWEQVSKLTPDDGAHGDLFGSSVSISGAMAVVGVTGDDDNGSYSGSAYIFEQTATGWEQIAKLTADDGVADDRFGGSVSISGTTAIVGMVGDDDNGSSSGSAYIFERSATGWEQLKKIIADHGEADDYFGYSVSISGTTAIAGAHGADRRYTNSGSAYTFPLVPQIDLQATSDTGPSDTDNITSDTTPTFDITATPYYRLYRDGTQISGNYETATSYTSAELPDGAYEYTVVAVDEAGNETELSDAISVTIDTQTPHWLPGDANLDDIVNATDAAILAANWQRQSGVTWLEGDFNGDGRVDDIDATIMAANWLATPSPTPQLPGDANGDGTVDVSDLGILSTKYSTTSGAEWEDGDFTGDGFVDVADLGILATNYGQTQTSATSATAAGASDVLCDLDNDGQVGLGDLAFFSSVYGEQPGITTDSPYAYAADFDGSGIVDWSDLGIFSSHYRQGLPESSIASPADAGQPAVVAPGTTATAVAVAAERINEKVADDDIAILAQHWMMAVEDMDDDDEERDAFFAEVGVVDDMLGLLDE